MLLTVKLQLTLSDEWYVGHSDYDCLIHMRPVKADRSLVAYQDLLRQNNN